MLERNGYGIWQIDLTISGIRHRKSTKTKDKTLALKLHALIEAEMLKESWGILKKSKLFTLDEAFKLAVKSHWKGNKSEYKVSQNWVLLSEHLDITKDVSSVTSETIRDITIKLRGINNSPATINRKLATLRTLLNLCIEWGKLTHAPKIKSLKEPPSRHRVLTDDEELSMMRFFNNSYTEEHTGLFEFLLSSGNRLSEVLKLTWFDVDFKTSAVRFTDTKSGETLHKPLTDTMKRVLELRRGLPVPFPYTIDMVESYWLHFRKHLGYQEDGTFVIHSLRHTCASRLVSQGVDLKRVQAWLGHKSYSTTLKYAQLSEVHLQDVVKVINTGSKGHQEFAHSLSYSSQTVVKLPLVANH